MAQIPVTLLTGYLGAGKTTLLNRILSEQHGKKYAVIVNEFGEIGIDEGLVIKTDEEIFEMNNGCICCTVRGDLIRIIGNLMKSSERFEGLLIETTGLADPAPVIQTFFVDDEVRERMQVDAVVTMIDAVHFLAQVEDSHEAEEQVAFADVILINKVDLISPEQRQAVEDKVRSLNRFAKIHHTVRAGLDLGEILQRGAFDLDRILEIEPDFLEDVAHEHDSTVTSVSLRSDQPLDEDRFFAWIQQLLRTRGTEIFRSKGILALAGQPERFVFQAVHMLADSTWGTLWQPGEKRESRLVLIGRNLSEAELERDFAACRAV
jgi:G3E family GTPase